MVGYGNEEQNWEIKFNSHTYEQLICRASTYAEIAQLPDLLTEIREKVALSTSSQANTVSESTFAEKPS
jgi:hypothetical protein